MPIQKRRRNNKHHYQHNQSLMLLLLVLLLLLRIIIIIRDYYDNINNTTVMLYYLIGVCSELRRQNIIFILRCRLSLSVLFHPWSTCVPRKRRFFLFLFLFFFGKVAIHFLQAQLQRVSMAQRLIF